MKDKLIYAVIVIVAVGLAAVGWMMWSPANNENFPEGTDWVCLEKNCGQHFKLTMSELGDHYKKNYGQRPKCPKCGKEAFRAEKCGHCGKVYPQSRGVQVCPYCKKEQVVTPPP
jgi:hypothetical protein